MAGCRYVTLPPDMLDFTPVRTTQMTMAQLAEGLTRDNLRRLTNEMNDEMRRLIAGCIDDDVVFVPHKPQACDDAPATEAEGNRPWTPGHVIAHTTASAEEYAFIAAELARGVPWRGRSRCESHWRTFTLINQCHSRLEESRRIRLAAVNIWPNAPHYDNTCRPAPDIEPINCVNRFMRSLSHDDSRPAQIAEIVRQARAARL